jgi:hypothetical protein
MAEVTSGNLTVIVLSANEADSLAAVLREHVTEGAMFAGHNGPIRRSYPYLTELAEAMV